ncbi:hypothetical protein [Tunturiibacter lichenicola]|uniref:hypothetical protein n=1 Tax=Tunturiibacter lichenicola TaxID=2051959 RepID=UPI0036F24807
MAENTNTSASNSKKKYFKDSPLAADGTAIKTHKRREVSTSALKIDGISNRPAPLQCLN